MLAFLDKDHLILETAPSDKTKSNKTPLVQFRFGSHVFKKAANKIDLLHV